ncbi:MAG: hypothetical protein V7719_15035 [Psychroserpens sp.]|uniref:hypothetical protein n=1 Tax=Psychroserpens sp. TaxID=2020870 RepID=UPI003001B230
MKCTYLEKNPKAANYMYSEIQQLKDFYTTHGVNIVLLKEPHIGFGLKPVQFTFRGNPIVIHIKDDYEDLKDQNPLLNLFLVLNELSFIDESTDFLNWCSENEVNASLEPLRQYYNDLLVFITTFKTYFADDRIDCFISDLDFQLNAGAAQYLRSI